MFTPIENAGLILKNNKAYEFDEFNEAATVHTIFGLGGLDVYAKRRPKMGRVALHIPDYGRKTFVLANPYEVIDPKTGAILRDPTRALRKGSTEFIGAEYVTGLAEHESKRHKEALQEIKNLEATLPDYDQAEE